MAYDFEDEFSIDILRNGLAPRAAPTLDPRAAALRSVPTVQERTDALMPSPKSPEELALTQEVLAAKAALLGRQQRKKEEWKGGTGLLGLVAPLLNKFNAGGLKPEEEYAQTQRTGLVKAAELANMGTRRQALDKARGVIAGQDFTTGENVKDRTGRMDVTEAGIEGKRLAAEIAALATQEENEAKRKATTENFLTGPMQVQRAEKYIELDKAANRAYTNSGRLDQFLAASDEDGLQGGAAEIIASAQNFLTTFGLPSTGLDALAQMKTMTAGIKADYMESLGARGLTDQDMKIIAESLPKVNDSRVARERIVKILKKADQAKMHNFIDAYDEMGAKSNQPKPAWYDSVKNSRPFQARQELKRRQLESYR